MRLTSRNILRQQNFSHPTLHLAFNELANFLNKSIGIVCSNDGDINVSFNLVSTQGFSVDCENASLHFSAPSEVEILYSVYTFAEEYLGYCFLCPDIDFSNPIDELILSDGVVIQTRNPVLENRGLIQEFDFNENSYKIADWMVKNKLNYLLVWMKYYDKMPDEMKEYFRIRGIKIECGHHNFEYFIPAQKYYKTNPEYFAIINGKRDEPHIDQAGYLSGTQLCTTNEGLRRELLKNIIAYCHRNPEIDTISLIPNDGFGWCECDDCKKVMGKPQKGEDYCIASHIDKAQNLYHDLIKYISANLKEVLPHITLTFAAYVNYIEPAENFTLDNQTAVHFATYWRCINHKINSSQCPINSKYAEALRKWVDVKNGGKINIYEYYMGINLYISLPMIHCEDVFDEVAYYKNNGIDGLLTQFQFDNWIAYGLNYYSFAKAAYGEKSDVLGRVYRAILPQNPQKVKAFYDYAKQIVKSAGECHIPYPRALFRRTQLEQYRKLHNMAIELKDTNSDSEFIEKNIIWTEYLMRFKQIFDNYTQGEGDIICQINEFIDWVQKYQGSNIFVVRNVKVLMGKWIEKIKAGRQWYHYGLDWEDDYIKMHNKTLNKKLKGD